MSNTSALAAAEPSEDANAVHVLSYNIRYLNTRDGEDVWANRRDQVCDVLRSADLIGLQECVVEQLEDIRKQTPEHSWYGVGRDDGQQQGEMTAIGYRKSMFRMLQQGTFWLSPTPQQVGSRGWDANLPRIASWIELQPESSQVPLIFVNTHFDHRGSDARHESARLLRRWIAGRESELPVILVGDFNAQISDAPLKALLDPAEMEAPALQEARAAPGIEDDGPNSTWNGFAKIEAGRRIDHVLYRGDLKVSGFQTLDPRTSEGRFASDHMPVKASFQLRSEENVD